jgi:hypothetical protein
LRAPVLAGGLIAVLVETAKGHQPRDAEGLSQDEQPVRRSLRYTRGSTHRSAGRRPMIRPSPFRPPPGYSRSSRAASAAQLLHPPPLWVWTDAFATNLDAEPSRVAGGRVPPRSCRPRARFADSGVVV